MVLALKEKAVVRRVTFHASIVPIKGTCIDYKCLVTESQLFNKVNSSPVLCMDELNFMRGAMRTTEV